MLVTCACKCFVSCADSKKELDAQAKALVKEAASPRKSPKKTTTKKTATTKKRQERQGNKKQEGDRRQGCERQGCERKEWTERIKGEVSSKKSQQKLAEIQSVQKEAEWMFSFTELEVSSLYYGGSGYLPTT